MLHGDSFGEAAGARNLMFCRVKWLQPAMNERYLICAAVAAAVGLPFVLAAV